jgi:hypothetical protein
MIEAAAPAGTITQAFSWPPPASEVGAALRSRRRPTPRHNPRLCRRRSKTLPSGNRQAAPCPAPPPQNTELCVINDATGTDAKACRPAGPRAFSPTSLVAQRDAGTGRRTLRAFASSCALTAWAGAADSAAAYPGMAACRGPTRWTPLRAGARLRTGSRSRTPAAPGSSWPRFPPLATAP